MNNTLYHFFTLCQCRYARERIEKMRAENLLQPRSRFANWQPLSATEFEGFLAITLNMGIIELLENELEFRGTILHLSYAARLI